MLRAAADGNRADHNKRILAALEHGGLPLPADRARRRHLDGLTVGLGAGLLLMSVMAWLVYDNAGSPTPPVPEGRSGGRTLAALPARPTAQQATAATAAAVNQAAAIITESPALERPASHPPATPGHGPTRPSIADANAAAKAATSTTMTAVAAVPKTAAAQERAVATVSATSTNGANNANNTSSRRAAAPGPPPIPTDTDVTLLTALVAHANGPTMILPERTRDVVERQDDDSSAALLARCKLLGSIEGMLCRSRICAGRWDSDAACRAPSH
ncbi:hypothetical protein [Rugamonas sp.]|uniref:hypothetical protein n=1 Tax=Rugamonas sp. TaxID=1926287 RepID=UPI0025FDF2EC|nr:hypothetical protein [Rugamonas sp.]